MCPATSGLLSAAHTEREKAGLTRWPNTRFIKQKNRGLFHLRLKAQAEEKYVVSKALV